MSRAPVVFAVMLIAMLAASVASAQHFEDDEEEDAPHPMVTWASDGSNRLSVGWNGILTAPADPVMFAIEGDEVFESLPAPAYTGRVVGFLAGACQMSYRMLMGTFDVSFAWMPYLYMQSPVPRFTLFPWMEHDDE